MTISSEIIIGAILCVAISQVPGSAVADPDASPIEDLQDEYYNVTPAMTDKFEPQDEKDAQAIFDSRADEKTIAGILSKRQNKERRYAINIQSAKINGDQKTRWISEVHEVQKSAFRDCCFSLVEKESAVLGNFLYQFLNTEDLQRTGFAIVLTKEKKDMITIYDSHFTTFDTFIKEHGKPCEDMLRNWSKVDREPLEKDEPNIENVKKDADALNTEHNNEGWKKTRAKLEMIFFQKSIKYARLVIAEFEKLNGGKLIEDIISQYGLNEDLANIYRTFALYIKCKHKFIAEILLKYSDNKDYLAVWNMCMAVIHSQEWPKVDEAFKPISEGKSLIEFITQKAGDNKITAELMATMIDPSFKPTEF